VHIYCILMKCDFSVVLPRKVLYESTLLFTSDRCRALLFARMYIPLYRQSGFRSYNMPRASSLRRLAFLDHGPKWCNDPDRRNYVKRFLHPMQ
jgi:hypothetical protein